MGLCPVEDSISHGSVKLHLCSCKSYICKLNEATSKYSLLIESTHENHHDAIWKLWHHILQEKTSKEQLLAMRNELESVVQADDKQGGRSADDSEATLELGEDEAGETGLSRAAVAWPAMLC